MVKHLIPFMMLLAACTSNKPMTDEQKTAVKNEGSVIVKEFFDALATSNIQKMSAIIENSADFNFIIAGDLYNYDSMMEMANKYIPLVEKQTFDTRDEKYIIVDPTCFIYIWHGRNGMLMKSGENVTMEDYVATYGFRKHEDGWKLFVGHESEKTPMPIDTARVN